MATAVCGFDANLVVHQFYVCGTIKCFLEFTLWTFDVDSLAVNITGVRLSLEPEFDHDPTISNNVPFSGVVQPDVGLAEIELFPANP